MRAVCSICMDRDVSYTTNKISHCSNPLCIAEVKNLITIKKVSNEMSNTEEATPVYPLAINIERETRERIEREQAEKAAADEVYAYLVAAFLAARCRDPMRHVLDEIKRVNIRHITANI